MPASIAPAHGTGNEPRGRFGPSSAARPRLLVSRCLDLDACRYDGDVVKAPLVRALARHAELVAVCPEVAIGLGVPRDPIRIVVGEEGAARRLRQPSTGRDLTAEMETWRESFLDALGVVDGAILKARSPSCGIDDVKRFVSDGAAEPAAFGAGVFAEGVVARLGTIPITDEARLAELTARDLFLARVFALARLREARTAGTRAALERFHAEHKLLLMAHHEPALRALGPLVARATSVSHAESWAEFEARFRSALAHEPTPGSTANALMHALGYFEGRAGTERRAIAERLTTNPDFASLATVRDTIREWVIEAHEPYLATQALLWPYPDALRVEVTP